MAQGLSYLRPTRRSVALSFDPLFHPRGIAIVGASADLSRIGGHPIKALKAAGYKGGIFPINPKYPDMHGLTCYPHVSAIDAPCDLAVVAVPAAGVRAGHPRLRQGRHSCGGGADRRLSRDRRGRSSPGSRIEAGRHRQRRARHRPELPGHAVRARPRVGRVRQPDRRDRAARRLGILHLPIRRLRLRHRQPRRGAGPGLSLLRIDRQRDRRHHARTAVGLSRRSRHLARLRLPGGHARRAPVPGAGPQVAGAGQAGADLEGRHHRSRRESRRLAHRQHDRQLRSLPRRHAPVRPDRGRRRRADRRHRQAVRARPPAARQCGRRAVDLGRLGHRVRRSRRALRADLAEILRCDARRPAQGDPLVRLGRQSGRRHRRRLQRHVAVHQHARHRAGRPRHRSAVDPAGLDRRRTRAACRGSHRRRVRQDRQAGACRLVRPPRQVRRGRRNPRGRAHPCADDSRPPRPGRRRARPLRR